MSVTTYTIPDADRVRLRDLRTIYAERLSEAEHDQLAGIILRGAITEAESQIVAALHAQLWHDRMHAQAESVRGGAILMPCSEDAR